jgi:tetratricopeptide (TPR) repeat protein
VRQARALLAGGHLDGAERALAGVPGGTVAQRAAATVTRGVVAWYRGDLDEAGRRADQAASLVAAAGVEQEQLADLQAMLAHADGRWERHTAWQLGEAWHVPELAGRVFDAYLCVTEYVLHTGDPYDRLAAFARGLHEQARRAGARRGEAFSATVLGEAELLGGDPEAAREHLAQATTISREVGAVSGEALARARLGEALLELGDRLGARAQLDEALELAHVSTLARHVLFLVYAPLLRLTEDPDEALVLLDGAEVVLEDQHGCRFCPVGFHVAAAMVCARAGELARARAFLQRAEEGAALWPGGPWRAAIAEALGELRRAEGAWQPAARALRRAAEGYAAAGQRLHEQRARRALTALSRD